MRFPHAPCPSSIGHLSDHPRPQLQTVPRLRTASDKAISLKTLAPFGKCHPRGSLLPGATIRIPIADRSPSANGFRQRHLTEDARATRQVSPTWVAPAGCDHPRPQLQTVPRLRRASDNAVSLKMLATLGKCHPRGSLLPGATIRVPNCGPFVDTVISNSHLSPFQRLGMLLE